MIASSKEFSSFTVKIITSKNTEILQSFNAFSEFCELINAHGQSSSSAGTLIERINKIKRPDLFKKIFH